MPGRYDDDDGLAAGGERLRGPILGVLYKYDRYPRISHPGISTKYRLKPPEKSIVFEEVSGDIWSIFNRAIFGRSRHSKYRPNIASLFCSKTGLNGLIESIDAGEANKS